MKLLSTKPRPYKSKPIISSFISIYCTFETISLILNYSETSVRMHRNLDSKSSFPLQFGIRGTLIFALFHIV